MKYIKYITIILIFSFFILFYSLEYLHTKMQKEYYRYYELTTSISKLNDTYSLCSGLIKTNPTQENIDSCNLVFNKIRSSVNKIKEECPYIFFYTEYITPISIK